MKIRFVPALCFSLVLLGISSSQAQFIVDPFNDYQQLEANQDPDTFQNGSSSGNMVGGTRTVQDLNFNATIYGGEFTAIDNSDTDPNAIWTMTYDGGENGFLDGLGNVDLTQGGADNAFSIDLLNAEFPTGCSLNIQVANFFVGSAATVSLPDSSGVFLVPFSDFQTSGASSPVNFSDVGYIQLTFSIYNTTIYSNNQDSEYFTLGSIETAAVPVPEPRMPFFLIPGLVMIFFNRKISLNRI
jgi:hypothetical protein